MDLMQIRRGLLAQMGNILPSFVGKIVGGSFVLDSNLSGDMVIDHNLGETPKGIVVYRLTGDLQNTSDVRSTVALFYVENPTGSTDNWWMRNSCGLFTANGGYASTGIQGNVTTGIRKVTATQFTITGANNVLLAGETYYWLAWNHKA